VKTPKPVKPNKTRRLSQRRASKNADVSCQAVVAVCEPDGAPSLCIPIDGSIASPKSSALFLPTSLPANGEAATAIRCGLYVGSRDCDPTTGTRIGSVVFGSKNGEVRFDLDSADSAAAPAWSFRKQVSVRIYDAATAAAQQPLPPRWSDDEATSVIERSIADSDAAVTSLVLPYDAEAHGARDHYLVVRGTVCPAAPLDPSKVDAAASAAA
jgi:hypothetical protein